MKLQPDRLEGVNTIGGYSRGNVTVNAQQWSCSVIIPWQGEVVPWHASSAAELDAEHFRILLQYRPELVIYGSGGNLRFPSPAWLRPLVDARVGLETMDTAAACRTYNVLAMEGRRVVAALLVG